MKVAVAPKLIPEVLQNGLNEIITDTPTLIDFANGHIYSYGVINDVFDLATIRQLAQQYEGYAVLLDNYEGQDRWGYSPESLPLMKEIKERWDPLGILNPGEFIV